MFKKGDVDLPGEIIYCLDDWRQVTPEALQNVAKYAQATAARVSLGQDGQYLTFTVEDDGQGFDQATTPLGTGLQGISDRLAALGGTIEITSAPGRGTRVTGRVPAGPTP